MDFNSPEFEGIKNSRIQLSGISRQLHRIIKINTNFCNLDVIDSILAIKKHADAIKFLINLFDNVYTLYYY